LADNITNRSGYRTKPGAVPLAETGFDGSLKNAARLQAFAATMKPRAMAIGKWLRCMRPERNAAAS
jgi:hypothetical protein